jgi:outer membrane usher protein
LSDFSLEAGFLRRHFGRESQDYGDFFASTSYRFSVTSTLTVEGNLQGQQGGLAAVSGGLAKAFPGIGTATLALAQSHSSEGDGVQGLIGLERRSGRHSFSVRSQMASENFRQIGIDTPQTVRRMDTAFWGYRMDGIGSFSLSYISQQLGDFRPIDIYSASYSTVRHAWGTFVVSATQSRSEISQSSVYFLWVLALEREVSASLMHLQGQNQREQTIFQANKSLPPGEGIGYRLQTAINASQQAAVFAQNRFGQGRLEAASLNDQTSARVGISGAVARLDDQWYLTRRIGSSYGLVRMPGLNNVRIYVDNQLATRTNQEGYAFLPRLHPYQRNSVSVEQMDLPMDTTIDALTVNPVPGWRSGVVIDFPVRQQAAATLNLILPDGKPVPAGALIRLKKSGTDFAVGRDGLTFVAGLENENQLEVHWGDRRCQSMITFTAPAEVTPHLGEFICREGDQ